MWENALSIFLYGGQASEITAPHAHTHTFLYMCVRTGPRLCACISTVVHAYKYPPTYKIHMWSTYAHAYRTHTTTTYICMGI